MSPRAIRRAMERKAAKLAVKASKVMTASVGSINNNDEGNLILPVVDFPDRPAVSDAKLLANRSNAQLSTGAKTPAGREASSLNAVTHGLTSVKAVLPGESAAAYEQLVKSHFERHSPASDEESELVQIVADQAWRILRIPAREAAMYEVTRREDCASLFVDEHDPVRRATLIDAKITLLLEKRLKNFHLQERRLRKQHEADLAKLKALQTERLEKPQREARAAVEENQRQIVRMQFIDKQASIAKLSIDPTEFGFDFSFSEWRHFRKLQNDHFFLTREYLNLNKVITHYRAAQKKELPA